MNTQSNQGSLSARASKVALSKRLEDLGWPVLLIAVSTIWLMPEKAAPPGSWLIVAGIILVGLNAIRGFNGIEMVGWSLVAGILALLAGLGDFFGLTLPFFAIALMVIGVVILLKSLFDENTIAAGNENSCCWRAEHDRKQDAMRGQAIGH